MHELYCEFRTSLKNLARLDLKIKIRRVRDIARWKHLSLISWA